MRKLVALLLLCCLGCGQDKENKENLNASEKKVVRDSIEASASGTPEKSIICFFSTENENASRNLRDSIILNLELTGEVVTGTFNWIPAEKDSRRGVIQATKTGDEVKGNYAFMQEGIEDTIFIEIQLRDTSAMITTLSEDGQEMILEVQRVDCL